MCKYVVVKITNKDTKEVLFDSSLGEILVHDIEGIRFVLNGRGNYRELPDDERRDKYDYDYKDE
jgi:hypothetical protein